MRITTHRVAGVVALLVMAACATPIPESSKMWVVRPAGTLQCAAGGVDLPRFEAELKGSAGVSPLQSGCADDGRMRAQACGLPDGRMAAFQLIDTEVAAVRRYGYVPLTQLPSARRVPC